MFVVKLSLILFGVLKANALEDVIECENTTRSEEDKFNKNNLLPEREICGVQDTNKILGGITTELNEFPWLVLLKHREPTGEISFACSGSLITNMHVLTAAHCVNSKRNFTLVGVRLGEWNVSSNPDCTETKGFQFCNDGYIDVGIESTTVHPDYQPLGNRLNDIALIKMNEKVNFTQFVKPICLPLSIEKPAEGEYLTVAGWGQTEFESSSSVKLKVQEPIVSNDRCHDVFKNAGVGIMDSHLCAGGEKNRGSCIGDSGGPLMQKSKDGLKVWMVQGISSFGLTICGIENRPGIYTRVSEYVVWINDNIQ